MKIFSLLLKTESFNQFLKKSMLSEDSILFEPTVSAGGNKTLLPPQNFARGGNCHPSPYGRPADV
jgi:hypothetical protein